MSCAYQYGVETTPQPAAMREGERARRRSARGSRYGVTNTSVAASRSASSSIERNRSSNSTCSPSPSSSTRRSSISRYRSPSRCATSGCVRPAITYGTSGCRSTIAGSASITVSSPLPGEISPNVESRKPLAVASRGARDAVGSRASLGGARGEHGRRAVRDDADLLLRAGAALDEQPQRRLGHHDHELRLRAERRRAPSPGAASAPRAPCAASRRAAAQLLARTTARTRRRAPPKIPYSCWSRTTSTSSRPRIRAART